MESFDTAFGTGDHLRLHLFSCNGLKRYNNNHLLTEETGCRIRDWICSVATGCSSLVWWYPDSPPVKGSVPWADGMAYTPDGPPTFVPFGQPSVAG